MGCRLQPVIRYPSGDLAEWADYENGVFRVLGRDIFYVRVGAVSIETKHLRQKVVPALGSSGDLCASKPSRKNLRDFLTLRVGHRPGSDESGYIVSTKWSKADVPRPPRERTYWTTGDRVLSNRKFKISATTVKLAELIDERPTTFNDKG
ncbi:uncharacterized protein RSE6_10563 [Rhynchosporium secalis]|uniref:Uncharacterized protein n=1 Tax=Rhynchosporium secalis TaxID=38038 RepID=A0A1E1MKR4_RHYSE|nr:uncharacterized protein RSE6_10563 [Rhynchosporium secalis]